MVLEDLLRLFHFLYIYMYFVFFFFHTSLVFLIFLSRRKKRNGSWKLSIAGQWTQERMFFYFFSIFVFPFIPYYIIFYLFPIFLFFFYFLYCCRCYCCRRRSGGHPPYIFTLVYNLDIYATRNKHFRILRLKNAGPTVKNGQFSILPFFSPSPSIARKTLPTRRTKLHLLPPHTLPSNFKHRPSLLPIFSFILFYFIYFIVGSRTSTKERAPSIVPFTIFIIPVPFTCNSYNVDITLQSS